MLAVAAVALALAATFCSAASAKPSGLTSLSWNSDGLITSIGPLKTATQSGTYRTLTLRGAKRKLGKPSSVLRRSSMCTAKWKKLGVTLLWTSFGVVRKGSCPPFLQGATLRPSSDVTWQTMNWLKIGDPFSTLTQLFPNSYTADYSAEDEQIIVDYPFGYGDDYSPTVTAVLNNDRSSVVGFRLFIGQAGD